MLEKKRMMDQFTWKTDGGKMPITHLHVVKFVQDCDMEMQLLEKKLSTYK
jgi:hypothetical protein